ncbi:hypothetical protein [Desulfogranum marinum]|uniref:hypothetical protein n=1 Tax=Desulfogranum marinum TaxID=453220 RepID=UPI0029C8BAD8|nr:hypothetical protein [Desulfogranum marinum]
MDNKKPSEKSRLGRYVLQPCPNYGADYMTRTGLALVGFGAIWKQHRALQYILQDAAYL